MVAVGNVDAHVTAPPPQALDPGHMLAIMGTSTCHIMNSDVLAEVPGMCGVVARRRRARACGATRPGRAGSATSSPGRCAPPPRTTTPPRPRGRGISVHELLTEKAAAQPVGGHGLLALDWHSGNRSVLVDHHLSGLIVGLTLDTRPEDVYRALIEATAFGTRTIVEAFERPGVPVTDFTAAGGLLKNRFLMQTYSDVLGRPINVARLRAGPGARRRDPRRGRGRRATPTSAPPPPRWAASSGDAYTPDPARAAAYDLLYAEYRALHDHFGRGGSDVMHRLRALRQHP